MSKRYEGVAQYMYSDLAMMYFCHDVIESPTK